MARPKTLRKPSSERLAREARRKAKRERSRYPYYVNGGTLSVSGGSGSGAGGVVQITSGATSDWYTTAPTDWGVPVSRFVLPERQIGIESLDEGVTWHTADTMQHAANLGGRLVVGTSDWGAAPEIMRQGSGTYRFQVTYRSATDEEARQWLSEHNDRIRDRYAREVQRQAEWAAREAELQATWEARETERQRQAVEAAQESDRAKARSEDLLRAHLTREQAEDLEKRGGFWVTSQLGNRYWVTRNTAVRFDENGVAIQRYCIHAVDHRIPRADNALMRKLVLECNEELFLRTANPGAPGRHDLEPERDHGRLLTLPAVNDYVAVDRAPQARRFVAGGAAAAAVAAATVVAGVGAGVQTPITFNDSSGSVTLTGGALTGALASGSGESGQVSVANGVPVVNLPSVDLRVAPILYWVNGVVRPLTG